MSEQQPKPDYTPQPNQILAQPATVQACQQDYAQAAEVRQVMTQQETRNR